MVWEPSWDPLCWYFRAFSVIWGGLEILPECGGRMYYQHNKNIGFWMVSSFPIVYEFCDLRGGCMCHFDWFCLPWAHFSWFLRVSETGLKFDGFWTIPWETPGLRLHGRDRVTRLSPGPVDSYFQHSLLTCRQLEADTRLADWQSDNCRLLHRKDSKTAAANIPLAAWWPTKGSQRIWKWRANCELARKANVPGCRRELRTWAQHS